MQVDQVSQVASEWAKEAVLFAVGGTVAGVGWVVRRIVRLESDVRVAQTIQEEVKEDLKDIKEGQEHLNHKFDALTHHVMKLR